MKLNRKGFTLIELLAVITILGILMIVGIPAVQRTINNSKKDTFVDTAKEYANAVKTAWASDDIKCDGSKASQLGTGTYYVFFMSASSAPENSKITAMTEANAYNNAQSLIQSGGKSSWGSGEVAGYVQVEIPESTAANQNPTYSVVMVDQKGHGFSTAKASDTLERSDIIDTEFAMPANVTAGCQVTSS